MGMLIEIVLEFIADLFIADGNGKWEKLKQTKYERQLRKWAREYEWFEYFYKDSRFTWFMNNDWDIRNLLRKKAFIRNLDLNLEARRQLEVMLIDKYRRSSGIK